MSKRPEPTEFELKLATLCADAIGQPHMNDEGLSNMIGALARSLGFTIAIAVAGNKEGTEKLCKITGEIISEMAAEKAGAGAIAAAMMHVRNQDLKTDKNLN